MGSQDIADFSDQRIDVFRFLKVTTLWIADRPQFFNQKLHFTSRPEYGADDAGHGDYPLKVIHRLAVDEDFKRAGLAVDHDVVDRDVEGMIRERRLELVGRAGQYLRARQRCSGWGGRFLADWWGRGLINHKLADYLLVDDGGHKICLVG